MSQTLPAVTSVVPLPAVLTLAAVLGGSVGSFLNVVVHRVPAGLSVVRPGSACPGCSRPVRGRDNVPLLSWLLLRGRCRDCSTRIPVRYPAVEAATALLFVALAATRSDPAVLMACLVVAAAGVALAVIDVEHGRLPFGITACASGLAGAALLGGWVHLAATLGPEAAWRGAVDPLAGAGLWFAVYGAVWLVSAGRGMGLGDVALAPLLGLVLGADGLPAAAVGLAAGFVLGAAAGGALLTTGRLHRGGRMPFGPFMLLGAGIGLFWGERLAAAYLGMVGLG